MADGILNHLILVDRKAIARPPFLELPDGASDKEVEDDEKDQNEDNSIHSGAENNRPQSYGRGWFLSRMSPQKIALKNHEICDCSPSSNGLS